MQISYRTNKTLQILSGISAILCIAARTQKHGSGMGRFILYAFFVLTVFLTAVLLLLRIKGAPCCAPETDSGVPPALPRRFRLSDCLHFAGDALALVGRHALLLLAVHYFDRYFLTLYKDQGRIVPVIKRLLLDLALTECILQTAYRIFRIFSDRSSGRGGRLHRIHLFAGAEADLQFLAAWKSVLTVVFFAAFAYFYGYRFLYTTMFKEFLPYNCAAAKSARCTISLLLLLAVFAASRTKSHLAYCLQLALLTVGVLHFIEGGKRGQLLWMCILIVAAAGKDYYALLKLFFIEGCILLLITFVSAAAGVIPDLVYYNGVDTSIARHALGTISPTDCSAHILYLALAWCMLRPNGRRWYHFLDYFALTGAFYIIWKVNVARANTGWMLLLIAGTFLQQVFAPLLMLFRTKASAFVKGAGCLLSTSFLCFFAYVYNQCLTMTGAPLLFETFFSRFIDFWSFRMRIYYGYLALKVTPVTWLGVPYKEYGNGGHLEKPENYTFLDISYIRILLIGGVLLTILFLGLYTFLQIRNVYKEYYYCFFLIFIVSLNFLFEHHMFNFVYQIVLLMVFADTSRVPVMRRPLQQKT